MIGLILVLTSTFFEEVGTSIGKFKVGRHAESIYTMGFLSLFWGTVFLVVSGFVRDGFVFSMSSLPTFSIRAVLEIAQAHVSILAVTTADRSTFGFVRIGTIPLLLAIDIFLGYTIGINQIIGIGIIIAGLVILLINHGVKRKGLWLVAFTAVNAAITISLFKYDITHFNSVESEQGIIMIILMAYFFAMAIFVKKEDPIKFLKKPIFLSQSLSSGIASVLMSFAYLFAPASIITTAKRSLTILWSILSGKLYFHEKNLIVKIVSYLFIVLGLVFLVI